MATDTSSREIHIYHASAGSGKTTQLMNIISKHVDEGYTLDRVAFVTFTKAAAQVAKERICMQHNISIEEAPHFSTIHAMCFKALGCTSKQIMDYEKYMDFGLKAGYEFKITVGRETLNYDEMTWREISDTQLVSFEQLYRSNKAMGQWLYDKAVKDHADFSRYCREYVKYKRTFGYLDFTDLLEQYIEKDLYEDVDIVCIDEAQDCSPLQWQVLFKAFRYAKFIYVAGDDKQELFAYAGADSQILTHLKGYSHIMENSYRVPKNILQFVQNRIVSQIEDVVHTDPIATHEGGEVKYITVLEDLEKVDKKHSYYMLARNKKFLQKYVDFCQSYCIPYKCMGVPVFSDTEKQQWRDDKTEDWDKKKVELAQAYAEKGTFYESANVNIDTIHAVKGGEADIVVLMTDMSRLTWKAYEDSQNAEHKVFYVGCTRAREKLLILEPQTKYFYPYIL